MKKKVLKIFLLLLVIVLVLVVFKNEIFILIEDVSNSFYRTVIEEQRYELLFEGFLSTTIISRSSPISLFVAMDSKQSYICFSELYVTIITENFFIP